MSDFYSWLTSRSRESFLRRPFGQGKENRYLRSKAASSSCLISAPPTGHSPFPTPCSHIEQHSTFTTTHRVPEECLHSLYSWATVVRSTGPAPIRIPSTSSFLHCLWLELPVSPGRHTCWRSVHIRPRMGFFSPSSLSLTGQYVYSDLRASSFVTLRAFLIFTLVGSTKVALPRPPTRNPCVHLRAFFRT